MHGGAGADGHPRQALAHRVSRAELCNGCAVLFSCAVGPVRLYQTRLDIIMFVFVFVFGSADRVTL